MRIILIAGALGVTGATLIAPAVAGADPGCLADNGGSTPPRFARLVPGPGAPTPPDASGVPHGAPKACRLLAPAPPAR